jgi:SnoaL-like domain
MATQINDLVTAYIEAVGEHRLEDLPAMLDPDVEFTVGGATLHGTDALVGAFERLSPIILRNDIRKVFVDGGEACVVYDFVTDTPVGAVVSVEYIKVKSGRIASVLLVFERLHWPEVQEELAERAARRVTAASA